MKETKPILSWITPDPFKDVFLLKLLHDKLLEPFYKLYGRPPLPADMRKETNDLFRRWAYDCDDPIKEWDAFYKFYKINIDAKQYFEECEQDIEERIFKNKGEPEFASYQNKIIYLLAAQKRTEATEEIVNYLELKHTFYSIKNNIIPEIWFYDDGIYKPHGVSIIKEVTRKLLQNAHTTHLVNCVISKIEADNFIDADLFFNYKNLDLIPIKNGVYNITTNKLIPFSKDYFFFSKLPIVYKKSASCDNIIKHFQTVLRNKEDILSFQELFGYLLYKENIFEVAVMMNGAGRNGKSKTLSIIKNFIGAENCCSISLEQLETDQYSMANLHGKLANLAGDLSRTALKNSGNLKNCIGRDLISGNRKNKSHLQFENYAKMFFSCNELPISYDNTVGFWSKWLFFDFPYTFINKEEYDTLPQEKQNIYRIKDENILNKLTSEDEMSGLFNWALEGLKRLFINKKFNSSKTAEEVKMIWIRKSDSLKAFCLDHITEDFDSFVTKKEFRHKYSIYCRQNKIKASSDKYIKLLLAEEFGVTESRPNIDGIQEGSWQGIKFENSKGSKGSKGIHIHLGISNSIENTGMVTSLTTLTNFDKLIHKSEDIFLPCHLCGHTPCAKFDENNNPLCHICIDLNSKDN